MTADRVWHLVSCLKVTLLQSSCSCYFTKQVASNGADVSTTVQDAVDRYSLQIYLGATGVALFIHHVHHAHISLLLR